MTAHSIVIGGGTADYMIGGGLSFPSTQYPWSIDFWIKAAAWGGAQCIVNLFDNVGPFNQYGLQVSGVDGHLVSGMSNGAPSSLEHPLPPSSGAWHNFILTYDGTTLKFYIDGVLFDSGALAHTSSTWVYWGFGSNNLVSADALGAKYAYLRLYQDVLTSGEATAHAAGTYNDADPDLMVNLDLHEGSGTTLHDISGNGHDAGITGGVTWDTDVPVFTTNYTLTAGFGAFTMTGEATTLTKAIPTPTYTSTKVGPPTQGYHKAGDVVQDANGALYLCYETGFPGKFRANTENVAAGTAYTKSRPGIPTGGSYKVGDTVTFGSIIYTCIETGYPGKWIAANNNAEATVYTKNTPGSPTGGFYKVNDVVVDSRGVRHRCVVTGFPGEWCVVDQDYDNDI